MVLAPPNLEIFHENSKLLCPVSFPVIAYWRARLVIIFVTSRNLEEANVSATLDFPGQSQDMDISTIFGMKLTPWVPSQVKQQAVQIIYNMELAFNSWCENEIYKNRGSKYAVAPKTEHFTHAK